MGYSTKCYYCRLWDFKLVGLTTRINWVRPDWAIKEELNSLPKTTVPKDCTSYSILRIRTNLLLVSRFLNYIIMLVVLSIKERGGLLVGLMEILCIFFNTKFNKYLNQCHPLLSKEQSQIPSHQAHHPLNKILYLCFMFLCLFFQSKCEKMTSN